MTDLLDNELVRKYFGCPANDCREHVPCYTVEQHMAFRVLHAMQQSIKKGERYLNWSDNDGGFYETMAQGDHDAENPHWGVLRLPDRFQKKECCDQYFGGSCPTCHSVHSCRPKPEPPKCVCNEILGEHWPLCPLAYEHTEPRESK